MQKIEALRAIAYNLRDLILDSTVASAYGSAMRFDELIYPNTRQLQGKYAYIYDGGGAGQSRVVGSIDPSTRSALFTQGFTVAPSINSKVILTNVWDKAEYDNAIDRMIGRARASFLQDKVATLALVGTQYEYSVPSGFEWISTLRLVPSLSSGGSASDYDSEDIIRSMFEIDSRYWRVEMNPQGSYIIAIDSRKIDMDNYGGYWVRIIGQAKPDTLGTDNATVSKDLEEFIITGASMLLSSQRMGETQEWARKFYMFRDNLNPLEQYIFSHGRGKKV